MLFLIRDLFKYKSYQSHLFSGEQIKQIMKNIMLKNNSSSTTNTIAQIRLIASAATISIKKSKRDRATTVEGHQSLRYNYQHTEQQQNQQVERLLQKNNPVLRATKNYFHSSNWTELRLNSQHKFFTTDSTSTQVSRRKMVRLLYYILIFFCNKTIVLESV